MIGDIIQAVVETTDDDDNEVVYKVPARVYAIDENGMLGINGKCSILVEYLVESEMDCYEFIDYVEPIPLTEEILKKNGFERNSIYLEKDNVMVFLGERIMFSFFDDWAAECTIDNFTIKYVHELQHLLRLCGLSYLADNFKVVGDEKDNVLR